MGFNIFKKILRLEAFLTFVGKLFQTVGAAYEKDVVQSVLLFVLGTLNKFCSPNLRLLGGTYGVFRLHK